MEYHDFRVKYESWALEHDAQLLELNVKEEKEPWIGYLIQGRTPADAPPGLTRMAIRSDDEWDRPCTLERNVVVNRLGWYYTEHPAPENYLEIEDWDYIS